MKWYGTKNCGQKGKSLSKNAFFCFWSRDIGRGPMTSWTEPYLPSMNIVQIWSNVSIHVLSYSKLIFPNWELANWELAIKLVCNIPGKDEDEILHSAVQIYEFHIFIISSSSFPGILRTNLMANYQLAWQLNWLEGCTGIAEVRVRIPARLIFSGFLFATA